MTKTDKKTDNAIRLVLTRVCETALEDIEGFEWLTHQVNYRAFPESLTITCVFDTRDSLELANTQHLVSLIGQAMSDIGIRLASVHRHIRFDTQEDCLRDHDGRWNVRLAQLSF
ncbi:Fis family transcriptional regulator [Alteromonas sp. CYL-A6]|uniref:Fis family transcriptional regulator n=1 Tax=Alteromonas nitratireducens TaxID=3390813 RepID=UPI0034AE2AC1